MKSNILIVEDHELTRFGLKTAFEACEYVESFLHFNPYASIITNIEEDLKSHKRRQNAKTFRALIRCMIENRTALREIPNAFIRCNNNAKDGFELWWEGRVIR